MSDDETLTRAQTAMALAKLEKLVEQLARALPVNTPWAVQSAYRLGFVGHAVHEIRQIVTPPAPTS